MRKRYREKVIDGKRYSEHRFVMEKYLGRKLTQDEHVHHINGNTLDNSIGNLELVNHKSHMACHIKGEKNPKTSLRDVDVMNIKKMFLTDKSNIEIAQIFNVNRRTIWQIRQGLRWSHIK